MMRVLPVKSRVTTRTSKIVTTRNSRCRVPILPRVSPTGCIGDRLFGDRSQLIFPISSFLSVVVSKSFELQTMSSTENVNVTDEQLFTLFSKSPKGASPKILTGSHRFLSAAIKNNSMSPSGPVLIEIFMCFVQKGTKKYVFKQMRKKILMELALCLVQDLISGGETRANSLEIRVEKCSAGNKKAILATRVEEPEEESDEFPLDSSIDWDIDEAQFCLHDKSGSSPDSKFTSGQGRPAPYSPPEADGSFSTPKKNAIQKPEKVSCLFYLSNTWMSSKLSIKHCQLN